MRTGNYTEQVKKIYNQGLFSTSSVQRERLGTLRFTDDGRVFVYAKAGSTALEAGKLTQAPSNVANHQGITPASTSIGAKAVTVTLGATAASANQYKDGWLVVVEGSGAGNVYKIKHHPAAAASSSLVVYLYDSLREALSSSSTKVSLVANSFNGTVLATAGPSTVLTGVPPVDVPANEFYWSQIKGAAPVLLKASTSIGDGTMVIASGTTAGAVEALPATYSASVIIVGRLIRGGADGKYGIVYLDL